MDLGNAVGAGIGRGGTTIRRIQEESGANIRVESSTSDCRITGTPDAVKAARTEIESIVQRVKDEEAKRSEARKREAENHLAKTGTELADPSAEDFSNKDDDENDENGDGWTADAAGW